jgi:DNA-binding winged helix-turn-helix (wHTH) protein/TolB-like protein
MWAQGSGMAESGRIRFGIFDFDPETRELRREGAPVRLQSQPAHVLALLVAHAGEAVTRDALQQALWGTDTFVDFDRGLNFCVAQIRAALGDSAESPRFVKTLPKRGYQFIAPVQQIVIEGPAQPAPQSPAQSAGTEWHIGKWQFATMAALVVMASVFALRPWKFVRSAAPMSSVRVAVARFDNQTEDSGFDRFTDGLTDALVGELTVAGSGRYSVIGNAPILRQPRAKRDLIAIASELNVGYVIIGQVQRNASGVHVIASLIRLPDQAHVKVARVDSGVDDPIRSQSELAKGIVAVFSPRLASSNSVSRRIIETCALTYSSPAF